MIFFDKPAPQGCIDSQSCIDWHEHQARIDQEVRKARERTLCVIRAEGDSIVGGPEVLCDRELPAWRPIPKTITS